MGIFWGLGLVLFFYPSYKNEPNHDGLLTSLAGIYAICVSLFPTNPNSNDSCAIFTLSTSSLRAGIHYTSAALMLIIFSYMSIRIFTKTDKENLKSDKNKWKRRCNYIYHSRVINIIKYCADRSSHHYRKSLSRFSHYFKIHLYS